MLHEYILQIKVMLYCALDIYRDGHYNLKHILVMSFKKLSFESARKIIGLCGINKNM